MSLSRRRLAGSLFPLIAGSCLAVLVGLNSVSTLPGETMTSAEARSVSGADCGYDTGTSGFMCSGFCTLSQRGIVWAHIYASTPDGLKWTRGRKCACDGDYLDLGTTSCVGT